jgi:nitrous oxidase accessory protein
MKEMPLRHLMMVLFLLMATIPLFSRTLVVRPGHSIRQVIQKARPFDTIYIKKGYYRENQIVVTLPVRIIGENYPVVDGEFKNEIFTIQSNDVLIQGLHLKNVGKTASIDWAAIKVLEAVRVTVRGNKIDNSYFGIYLSASNLCLVENNYISGIPTVEQNTGNGIHAWKCDSILIRNNQSQFHRDGIYFEFVTNSSVENNFCTRNIRYGLHFMFSHNDAYIGNTFRNNGAGVAVMYTKKVRMISNHFEDNWGGATYGLLLKDISDSHIEQNTFTGNTTGIYVEGSSRNTVFYNLFKNNGYAIRVQASCDDNDIAHNNFLKNTFDIATNGTLNLNKFNGNYWDKYEGYDLDHDGKGDIPYNPVNLFSRIIEDLPVAMMLYRSFVSWILDRSEKIMPSLIPDNLLDSQPLMQPL